MNFQNTVLKSVQNIIPSLLLWNVWKNETGRTEGEIQEITKNTIELNLYSNF